MSKPRWKTRVVARPVATVEHSRPTRKSKPGRVLVNNVQYRTMINGVRYRNTQYDREG